MNDQKPKGASKSKTESTAAGDPVETLTYEVALAELESIIARIESGNVPLDESLRQYRRGAALVRRCREVLESARTEIERIAAADLVGRADDAKSPSAR
ncbi:MAG: exodeoxyribonuclease VII small subunit [Phycisphaerales bacterium]|nr:exodeoxyribonuclease VII small subunit [Phycisphaerales bacterium]